MSKRIIIIVALVAVGIAAALAFRGRSQPDGHIRISGNIELTQVNIAFKISGRLIERAVDEGAAENERARKDFERGQALYKQDDISTSQFDQYRARADSASAALRQAQERLKLVEAGPRQEAIDAARAQVNHSAAAVKWA